MASRGTGVESMAASDALAMSNAEASCFVAVVRRALADRSTDSSIAGTSCCPGCRGVSSQSNSFAPCTRLRVTVHVDALFAVRDRAHPSFERRARPQLHVAVALEAQCEHDRIAHARRRREDARTRPRPRPRRRRSRRGGPLAGARGRRSARCRCAARSSPRARRTTSRAGSEYVERGGRDDRPPAKSGKSARRYEASRSSDGRRAATARPAVRTIVREHAGHLRRKERGVAAQSLSRASR